MTKNDPSQIISVGNVQSSALACNCSNCGYSFGISFIQTNPFIHFLSDRLGRFRDFESCKKIAAALAIANVEVA